MENCLYQGETICTYDLKDDSGIYYEDMVLDWKQAAADRLLTCTECGAHVYLAAGPIKEPYFAHYDLAECDYGSGHETEELKLGKRLIYQLLKRSFPKGDIQARLRMGNGLYSTCYCILEDGRSLAVDYRLQNNSLEKFRERDNFYQTNKIMPIYVLGKKQEKNTKQIDWYQNLLQSSMGYLIFMDTDRERLTLKRSISYRLGSVRKFAYCIKTYPMKELVLDQEGQMICSFSSECALLEKQIGEEKLQFRRQQEQLKQLKEEKLRQEERDRDKREAYHRLKEQEDKDSMQGKDNQEETDSKQEKDNQEETGSKQEKNNQEEKDSINKAAGISDNLESFVLSLDKPDLNPIILEKCRRMIAEGNAHLVSKKYYEAIMGKE